MIEASAARLMDELRGLAARCGVISVERYMRLCLMHPQHGYYATRQPFGVDGDFITAPEIAPMFGEFVGAWLWDYWLRAGAPRPCRIIEIGGGRGWLALDIIRVVMSSKVRLEDVSLHMIEPAAAQRQRQQQMYADACRAARHDEDELPLPAFWHGSMEEVPAGFTLLVANEVLDAMPTRQYRRSGAAWFERCIALKPAAARSAAAMSRRADGELIWREARRDERDIPPTLLALAGAGEGVFEFSHSCEVLCDEVAARLAEHKGAALLIDYGSERQYRGWSLQAVRAHERVDPLHCPGLSDLSVHADFSVPRRAAAEHGVRAQSLMTQRDFLLGLGMAQRARQLARWHPQSRDAIMRALHRLTDGEQMGELFKVMALHCPTEHSPYREYSPPPFVAQE